MIGLVISRLFKLSLKRDPKHIFLRNNGMASRQRRIDKQRSLTYEARPSLISLDGLAELSIIIEEVSGILIVFEHAIHIELLKLCPLLWVRFFLE